MSIFSRKLKHNRVQESRKRAKLFVLATKPSTSTNTQTTEWVLEISVPVSNIALSGNSEETKKNLFSSLSRRSTSASPSALTSPTEVPAATSTNALQDVICFSRLDTQGSTVPPAYPVALRIFLADIDSTSSATQLHDQIAEALSVIHITPDSDSYLRQALYALQAMHMIPSLSHGLDINKLVSFATSYPTSPVSHTSDSGITESVNYSRIVHDNARLKRMFNSEDTDYTVINTRTPVERTTRADREDDTEDLWNSLPPSQTSLKDDTQTDRKKGFWFTYGSEGLSLPERRRNSSIRSYEPSNVYGGLM